MKNFLQSLKTSLSFKLIVITILIGLLMIPTSMVKSLIHERQSIHETAIREVSDKWGREQYVLGPYIAIPFSKLKGVKEEYDLKQSKAMDQTGWVYLLPDQLNIQANVKPEKRYRGIHEVVVYDSQMQLNGNFNFHDLNIPGLTKDHLYLDRAVLNVAISDTKGLENNVKLKWNKQKIEFNSGLSTRDISTSGIHALINLNETDDTLFSFSLQLDLKGSQNLNFVPLGKTTDVQLQSNWDTPSFIGNFLPDDRQVNAEGFTAHWNIQHFNRNYPQAWINRQYSIYDSAFGTQLMLPVDKYKKSFRVAKYGLLFLMLTFLVFFLIEILKKLFIHPIQYMLVGIALVLFFTLLLALSEHIRFNLAYLSASIATISLISWYTISILRSKSVGMLILGILSTLYGFIFIIIQMEESSLLMGSIGIFIILALVMYYSRKIDWYSIRRDNSEVEE